ncbi:MAG: hypothetical protein Tsb0034_09190 [Ekhidna sp.]
MSTIGIFGLLCGSAVMITLFLAAYFLFVKSKEASRFLLTGFIFLAIALRIGKSVFFFLLRDMAPFGLALGFLGLASIGPLVWLHAREQFRFQKSILIHFIVPVVGAVTCFVISPSPHEGTIYKAATVILMGYLIAAWLRLSKESYASDSLKSWNRNVMITMTGIWGSFVYQHLAGTMMDYAIGSLIASGFIYWIFFKAFGTELSIGRANTVTLPKEILEKVRAAFEQREVYKQQGLTLNDFSSEMEIPPYLVTKSVKKLYNRSFPETLNYFRVEAVKTMLLDDRYQHLKIESLAYEVGFSSPSSFYASFKKIAGSNPKDYQKSPELKSA